MSVAHRRALVRAAMLATALASVPPTHAVGGAPRAPATGRHAGAEQLPPIALGDGSRYDARRAAGKILVVNFWASWCGPCLKELPGLDRLAARRSDLVVVAASIDADRRDAVQAFAGRYPHLHLAFSSHDDVRRYGALGTPYSVIFGRAGREVARVPRALVWGGAETAALLKRAG